MNDERGLQVQREPAFGMAHNRENLSVGRVLQTQRLYLAAGPSHLIIRHKSPGAHNAERHVWPVEALKPTQRRVLRVGQKHPAATVFHADQTVYEREYVRIFDRHRTKTCR